MWTVKLPVYVGDKLVWKVVDEFDTQEEAIEFVRIEFRGAEDGTIQLVYEE